MYSQLIIGAVTGIATFLAVILAYIFVLKPNMHVWGRREIKQQSHPAETVAEQNKSRQHKTTAGNESVEDDGSDDSKENIDPVTFAEHIPSEIKKAKQRLITKEIEAKMTADDREKERETQRQQLEAIFKLMQQQEDKFGMEDITEMSDQMKYYM